MNKVDERCEQNKHAKFYYASNRIFNELKIIRVVLYFLAIIPVVLTFIPQVTSFHSLICSLVSFALSIITECATSFLNKHKDAGIHSLQLYETGVTGSAFSKIEYDREMTNELNELAIRKGLPKIQSVEQKHKIDVPSDINDDYSYLYICRMNAATNKYLLSRIFYIYFFFLMGIIALFVGAVFFNHETSEYLALIIAFYPLISPIIRDCNSCKECMRYCTKICADIDNYFADGDCSFERLARMYYYVQQIECEMYKTRPTVFNVFRKIFRKGIEVLQTGVTDRFRAAIVELKQKALITKGVISMPRGKSLITQKDYDLDYLKKIERERRANLKTASAHSSEVAKQTAAAKAEKPVIKTVPRDKKTVTVKPAEVKKQAQTAKTVQTKTVQAKTVAVVRSDKPKKTASAATETKKNVSVKGKQK